MTGLAYLFVVKHKIEQDHHAPLHQNETTIASMLREAKEKSVMTEELTRTGVLRLPIPKPRRELFLLPALHLEIQEDMVDLLSICLMDALNKIARIDHLPDQTVRQKTNLLLVHEHVHQTHPVETQSPRHLQDLLRTVSLLLGPADIVATVLMLKQLRRPLVPTLAESIQID